MGYTPDDVEKEIETVLELNLPPGLRTMSDPIPSVIWTFSFDETLTPANTLALADLVDSMKVDVTHVDPGTLPLYNKTEMPIHPAFNYLSLNHKVDYLHAYFAQNYGGGLAPLIKRTDNASWLGPMTIMQDNASHWLMGVPVDGASLQDIPCDDSNVRQEEWCEELIFADTSKDYNLSDTVLGMKSWQHSKGPCCPDVQKHYLNILAYGKFPRSEGFIARKQTPFTKDWLNLVHEHLDGKLEILKAHPSPPGPCCKDFTDGYPIRWDELKAEIWAALVKKYQNHVLFDLRGIA